MMQYEIAGIKLAVIDGLLYQQVQPGAVATPPHS